MLVENSFVFSASATEVETYRYKETARQETLVLLRHHLSAVLSKHPGQVVAVTGEAGVGKTFVLETLLQETPCKYLWVQSTLTSADIIKALPEGNFPRWVVSQLEHLAKNETLSTRTSSELLAAMLSALAPFILVVEDIHDASPERQGLISQLARVVPRLRGVGLFVTSRANVPTPFKSYHLGRLDKVETTELLEYQVKAKLPEEGLEWVYAKSKGNPLFALEFWRYLSQQGYFWSDGSR